LLVLLGHFYTAQAVNSHLVEVLVESIYSRKLSSLRPCGRALDRSDLFVLFYLRLCIIISFSFLLFLLFLLVLAIVLGLSLLLLLALLFLVLLYYLLDLLFLGFFFLFRRFRRFRLSINDW